MRSTAMSPDPRARDERRLRAAHESFVTTGAVPPGLRPFVAASWRRSARSGVDPDVVGVDVSIDDADLAAYRAGHALAPVMPVVRELLLDAAVADGLVVAVMDDAGRLLWVEGNHGVRDAVGRVGFVEGAVWREERVGTNAPGTALATRRPVQVLGAEHWTRPVQDLSCAAAPIRDASGRVLGVLDVTGGGSAGSGVVMSLVRASVAAVEAELAARAARGAVTDDGGRAARPADGTSSGTGTWLEVLGRSALHLGPGVSRRLGPRHAEILLLLAEHRRGLSADELAVLLHPGALSEVAVRAEVSRLRRVVGDLLGGSRPYRLARPLATDVGVVRDRLAAGDLAGALAAYAGPVLPRSFAPGVEALRAELRAELRGAVLASPDAASAERWLASDEGADDLQGWRHLAALVAPGTPARTRALARVALLDRALG
ncbi:helix-turn-helix domain-containing protein [Cellulomonas sp. PhB143]|uniref:helix-turn-helix domain-containing protein n=1 Tax=Cellulomonas sp. PhB143 TaxID=2485186 RepID=UPI000FAC2594|nr:helix-turn-helix domain-containing protein [Cellulomonas sp. PhB143]ROS76453.1 GAF domain-containing protein [Cellulomonas sp. PhB143]